MWCCGVNEFQSKSTEKANKTWLPTGWPSRVESVITIQLSTLKSERALSQPVAALGRSAKNFKENNPHRVQDTMKAILFVVLIQLGNVSLANSAAAKAKLEVSLSGTLHGGIMAIGGETTGWELAYSKNGQRSTVEVDMEAIEKAMAFDGKKVTISGELGVKNYLERGAVRILTAKTVVFGKPDNRRGGEQNKSENQQLLAHTGEALRLSRRSKFFGD